MNGANRRIGVLCASGLLCAATATAQLASEQALDSLQSRPRVEVSLRNQVTRDVTEAIDVRVQISNLTDKDFYIREVKVGAPGALLNARGLKSWSAPQTGIAGMLKPGFDRVVFVTIPPDRSPIYQRVLRAGLIGFLPGRYEIPVTVRYEATPEPSSELDGAVAIDLEPPLTSLLAGGVLGSLLLACFVHSFRFLRERKTVKLRDLLVDVVATGTAGAVCAAIAVLLLNRLQDANLPLQITVADFVGGVVVGLFAFKLGDWIYRQLGIAQTA